MTENLIERKFFIATWYLFSGHGNSEEISQSLEISRVELLKFTLKQAKKIVKEVQEELSKID